MAISFLPASGTLGSVSIGNLLLVTDTYDWDVDENLIPQPRLGTRNMEYCDGKVSGTIRLEGPWNLAVNPFGLGIKISSRNTLTLRITNVVVASTASTICKNWHITDHGDGQARYSFVAFCDGLITDFSGTPA